MALKRTQNEISYASKVGVNRGAGFANLAQASERRSTVFDKMADTFATKSLQEIKTKGAEQGAFAGQEYQFTRQEKEITDPNNPNQKITVTTLNPITRPESLNTRSSQQAFDKIVYERYIDEIDNDIKQLTLKERDTILRENGTVGNFESIINPQLDVIFNEISSTSVENVARNLADKYLIQYGAEVDNNHQKFVSKLDSNNSKNKYNNKLNLAKTDIIYGVDVAEAKEMVSKVYEDWKTSNDAGMEWAQGYDIMSDLQQLDANYTIQSVLNPFLQGNFETDDRLRSQYRARNYQQVINLLDGGQTQAVLQQVIDGEEQQKTITMDDIKGFTKAQYQTIANTYGTLERQLTSQIKNGDFAFALSTNAKSNNVNPDITYVDSESDRTDYFDTNAGEILNDYRAGNNNEENKIGYLNHILINNGTLGSDMNNLIKRAVTGNSINAYNNLKDQGFFNWATRNSRVINRDGRQIKVKFDPIGELGFAGIIPDSTVSSLRNFMKDLEYTPNIDDVIDRTIKLNSDSILTDVSDYKNRHDIDDDYVMEEISKAIPDHITNLDGIDDGLKELPTFVVDNIMKQIDKDIKTNRLTDPEAVEEQINYYTRAFFKSFGVSRSVLGGPELGGTGYYLTKNWQEYNTTIEYLQINKNGVPELRNDDKWFTPLLVEGIKRSDNFKDPNSDFNLLTDDEYVLGENLFLQSTELAGFYNIMFNDDSGIPIMIEENSFPMQINLGTDGTSLYNLQGKRVVKGKNFAQAFRHETFRVLGNEVLRRGIDQQYISSGTTPKEDVSLLSPATSYPSNVTTEKTDFDLGKSLSDLNENLQTFVKILSPEFELPEFMNIFTGNIVGLNRELTTEELIILRDTNELPEDVTFE